MTAQTRSTRLETLRKKALKHSREGKTAEYILLSLKSDIVMLGVSKTTAKDYFDTVVGQISK